MFACGLSADMALISVDFNKDCAGYIKFVIVDFILASLKSEKFSWLWYNVFKKCLKKLITVPAAACLNPAQSAGSSPPPFKNPAHAPDYHTNFDSLLIFFENMIISFQKLLLNKCR